jgi:hypothetical protein
MAAPTPAEIAAAQAVIAAAVAPVVPAAPAHTFGQALDADVAALKARVSAIENKTVTWIGKNWPHLANGGGIAYAIAVLKHVL